MASCGDSRIVPITCPGNPSLPAPIMPNDLVASSIIAGIVPTVVFLYLTYRWRKIHGPTPDFYRLRVKPVNRSTTTTVQKSKVEHEVGAGRIVTWLGQRELRVLEALGDTLLPGFEVGTAEDADTTVEQVGWVIVMRGHYVLL